MYATTMRATRGSVKTVASAEIKPVRGQTVVARAAKSDKLAVSVASGAAAVSGLAHAEAARAGNAASALEARCAEQLQELQRLRESEEWLRGRNAVLQAALDR